jgi:hypothetical protein
MTADDRKNWVYVEPVARHRRTSPFAKATADKAPTLQQSIKALPGIADHVWTMAEIVGLIG